MKKPNLFIVGAGRSGTTTLHEWLKDHPEVFMSEVKGPNFFGEEPNPAFPEFFKNKKKYMDLFKGADNKKILGESSHYFWSKTAPKEITEFNPESKILIILRNPLDVAYSYYKNGDIPNNIPFEESLKLNDERVKKMFVKLNFAENLQNYLDVFGKNVYLIIIEEMNNDLEEAYKKLCRFLGINDSFLPDFENHNQARELKNKWLVKLIEKAPAGFKLLIKSLMTKKSVKRVRTKIIKFTTKKDIKDTINPELRKRLFKEYFAKEKEKTEKILNKKLDFWK